MVDFSALLSKNVADVKKPPLLPVGTYFGTITKKTLGESKQKKTPFVEFAAQITRAGDDVDPSLLGEIDVSRKSFSGISNNGGTFYMTDDSAFRLVDFCKSFGQEVEGLSMGELIEIPVGREVMVSIKQEMNPNNNEFYNKLDRMVGVSN